MKATHLMLLGVALLGAFGSAARVRACSPLPCYAGQFLPHDGARIPANTPALGWLPPLDRTVPPGRPEVMLIRLDEGTRVEIELIDINEKDEPALVRIVPSELHAGVRYRLQTAAASCTTSAVEFEVMEEAQLPAATSVMALGAPVVVSATRDDLSVWTTSGVCYAPLPVTQLSIELQHDAAAEPWSALFVYRTVVDAKPWNPTLEDPSAVGTTRVFGECPAAPARQVDPGIADRGLALGKHKLHFEAKLLGAPTSNLTSSELIFELDCGQPESASQTNTICSTTRVAHGRSRLPFVLLLLPLLFARRRAP